MVTGLLAISHSRAVIAPSPMKIPPTAAVERIGSASPGQLRPPTNLASRNRLQGLDAVKIGDARHLRPYTAASAPGYWIGIVK
jgi:hypothetical protein